MLGLGAENEGLALSELVWNLDTTEEFSKSQISSNSDWIPCGLAYPRGTFEPDEMPNPEADVEGFV